MTKTQKVVSAIVLLIVLISLVIAGMYLKNKNLAVKEVPVVTETTTTPLAVTPETMPESTSAQLVGTWKSEGNYSLYATINFLPNNNFNQKIYFMYEELITETDRNKDGKIDEQDKTVTEAGTWKVTESNNEKYLLLTYNKKITPPKDKETLGYYKEWGQEFIGDNQIKIKLTDEQSSNPSFRFEGYGMKKIKSTDTQ